MKNLAWLLLLAACGSSDDSRECTLSSECVQGNIPGTCLASSESEKTFCAYPDSSCPSGDRWGVAAGDGLAGDCVAAENVDAGEVDAGDQDAAPPNLGHWSEPELLQNVNTEFSERSPSLSRDGLELYFVSNRPGTTNGDKVFVARRASTSAPFGTPVEVNGLNVTSGGVHSLDLADSGLELYMQNGQTSSSNVVVSTRATPTAVWGAAQEVLLEGTIIYLRDISLSGDGLTLYLVDTECSAAPCIRRTTRVSTASAWGELPELSDSSFAGLDYGFIDISPDELRVVLCGRRSDGLPAAVEALRSSKSVPFADFEMITSLEGAGGCSFSTDGGELYMSISTERGGSDLAISVRQAP